MLSTKFDSLFASIGSGLLPVPFLRVLSYNESSLDPSKVTPSSNATGLFQVVSVVLKDYNLLHGTHYTLEDTKDPALNSKIGVELLERIIRAYNKNHPQSLAMDWDDPRYVALVVQGFNAGYSEKAGVGFVVGELEKAGLPKEKITVDRVAETAPRLKASRFLSEPKRVSYAKHVAAQYFKEKSGAQGPKGSSPPPLPPTPDSVPDGGGSQASAEKMSGWPYYLLAGSLALGFAAVFLSGRK